LNLTLSKTSFDLQQQPHLKQPLLISWGVRAVYIGPGFQLPAHRNTVAVLALALNGPMGVAHDPLDPAMGFRSCRSVLVEPNQLHLLRMSREEHAFIYVDALSQDLTELRNKCACRANSLHFDFCHESEVIDILVGMPRDPISWSKAQALLTHALGLSASRSDPRIARVVRALLLDPDDAHSADEWAKTVGLSSSFFQHLFKQRVGVSFRRFRLWARIRIAVGHAMHGTSLTQAAMLAGFSSSAHLSTTFKDMFGISPSQLLGASPLFIETPGSALA
jgi:AraC-like DNA-binding protein